MSAKKHIAALLVCTVTLLTVPPAKNFAQAQLNAAGDQYLRDSETKRTPDLKASFAAELARIKTGTLTRADFNRIEKGSQTPSSQPSFSKREKIFLVVWIVATTALVVFLIRHPCKAPKDCEPIDDSNQY